MTAEQNLSSCSTFVCCYALYCSCCTPEIILHQTYFSLNKFTGSYSEVQHLSLVSVKGRTCCNREKNHFLFFPQVHKNSRWKTITSSSISTCWFISFKEEKKNYLNFLSCAELLLICTFHQICKWRLCRCVSRR